ncbi:MAG: 16S rRNA (cytidine(1402)-2'-O)-methyltransferase [Lachnospiraceae bacterium]|nr:16S rRNA (cytidine(1402)-2'-O)-methyltransferase [Lachnospiraceae bacterium]
MSGILYIVATPIGNTGDITERAKQILAEADIIASEDTRVTQKLLMLLGIQNKTVSNHKFNEKRQVDFLISALAEGKNVAIVSDAGTPCISDPGSIIIKEAVLRDINIIAVPGVSSVISALSVCGFNLSNFAFYGFLPKEAKDIKRLFESIKKSDILVSVFFESPKRVKKTVEILADLMPDAEICLCNDLTKMFERIYRGKPMRVLTELLNNPSAEKGEYTLIIERGKAEEAIDSCSQSEEAMLIDYIIKNEVSMKDAISNLAVLHKGTKTKKDFYAASLNLRKLFLDE